MLLCHDTYQSIIYITCCLTETTEKEDLIGTLLRAYSPRVTDDGWWIGSDSINNRTVFGCLGMYTIWRAPREKLL